MSEEIEVGGSPFMRIMPQHRRRRGRPRTSEPHSTVSVWVPTRLHDQLIKLANEQEKTVSQLVKSLLMLRLK